MKPDVVFKAYDVRGRIDNGELDAQLFELIGGAVVQLLGAETVAIGRDCRESSYPFSRALGEGVLNAGADVIDLGEVPTDAVYYFSGANDVPGAIITASHNPPHYNGLKLCRAGAAPIGADTGLTELRQMVEAGAKFQSGSPGESRTVDVVDDYVDHLFSIVPPEEIGGLVIAADGGNGMAGVAIERVFDRIDATLEGLYLEPDGSFPNHPADPLVDENLADLKELMGRGDFDLGVAFDGDADRAFFLDDRARPLSGSTVTSLIARRMLEDNPGGRVVHNLITSRAVPEIVVQYGGEPIRTRVGHSFIKQVMADTGAIFGGEHSGHYYFKDNFRADSGMLAMLVLLSVLSAEGRPLSEVRLDVERYASSGELNYEVAEPSKAIDAVDRATADLESDRLDGLTVNTERGWFNLRPSNTEPLLRLNVEAETESDVRQIVRDVEKILEESR